MFARSRRWVLGLIAGGVVIAAAVRRGRIDLLPHQTAGAPSTHKPNAAAPRITQVGETLPASQQTPASEPDRARPVAESAPGPAVGSGVVLKMLWTSDELRARPNEARIHSERPPDHSPPDRTWLSIQQQTIASDLRGSIRRVAPANGAKLVALTFDLCERADDVTGYDGAIVDILREGRVPATFFAGGKWMRSHPERAQQLIADPLFEVGNHGWTHGNLRVLGGEAAEQQVLWTNAQYEIVRERIVARATNVGIARGEIDRIPLTPKVFRFPYGTCSADTLSLIGRLGMAAIQWDVISGDAVRHQSPNTVHRTVIDQVRPGSIVVCHGNGRGSGTAEALPAVVRDLASRGYRFVTVSHLLNAGQAITFNGCYELRPGDNQRYDRLFGEGTG